ncbi:MAG: hypothetical protein ACR2PI_26020 [Hyphomicrobiaceae bacterium]
MRSLLKVGAELPYKTNIELAEAASAYVKVAMPNASDNRPEHVLYRRLNGSVRVFDTVEDFRSYRRAIIPPEYQDVSMDPRKNVGRYIWEGQQAELFEIGNCAEMAAAAFRWLIEVEKIEGVGLFQLFRGQTSLHAFILLGLCETPQAVMPVNIDLMPAGWPPDSVWCDPWNEECFRISDNWSEHVQSILKNIPSAQEKVKQPWSICCAAYH